MLGFTTKEHSASKKSAPSNEYSYSKTKNRISDFRRTLILKIKAHIIFSVVL